MVYVKKFDNGLRLIAKRIDGLLSVSAGVLVKTGSMNESSSENGISHFIEHVMFKGTEKRSAFDISDHIDRIGAQINAFTSKELTCYYTKSTKEHLENSLDILSDIFFNSVFEKEELEKEKGVVIEEIKMCEDTPEDLCLDLLARSYYGENGLGQTILGSEKNVKSFNRDIIRNYMDKYYTADNVVISIVGNIDVDKTVELVERYFADKFKAIVSVKQNQTTYVNLQNLCKSKRIEQTHLGFAMKGFKIKDELSDAFSIANNILGGSMSSRLFQKIREELGLCYSVYSYASQYKDNGILEIYAGVNTDARDKAVSAIVDEIRKFKKDRITQQEFIRGKEQIKSSFIFGQESTASQMIVYGKYMIFLDEVFDFDKRIDMISKVSYDNVCDAINHSFDIDNAATATVGPKRSAIKFN